MRNPFEPDSLADIIIRLFLRRRYNVFFVPIIYAAAIIVSLFAQIPVVFYLVYWYTAIARSAGADNVGAFWIWPRTTTDKLEWIDLAYLHLYFIPATSGWDEARVAYDFTLNNCGKGCEPDLYMHAYSLLRSLAINTHYRFRYWPLEQLYLVLRQVEFYQDNKRATLLTCLRAYIIHESTDLYK